MKRLLSVTLLITLLVTPCLGHAQGDPDPQAIAQAVIDNMLAGDFEAATIDFSAEIAAALPAARLAETWAGLEAQVGAFQAQQATYTQVVDGQTVVTIELLFEAMLLDAQISVDEAGKITGFYIRPSAGPPPPAYESPDYVDPNAFEEQAITLNAGTEWELPGTLTLPVGEGPFPAVVLVHGSGPNDRDETAGPNKPFRDLAEGLASQGIAVLRYDKRTLAHGAAMVEQAAFTVDEETVADAVAAVALLQAQSLIDPDRIYVLGHSLGGYLAPRIAQRADVAGLIVLAGNVRPLPIVILDQVNYLAQLDGDLSADDQAAIAATEQAVEKTLHAQPEDDPAVLLFNAPAVYWIDLNAYDPVAVAQEISVPMLILQGERDYQVTMTDFEMWQTGLNNIADITFTTYPDLNHLFISGTGPSIPDEYQTPGHVAEDVVQTIANWILTL